MDVDVVVAGTPGEASQLVAELLVGAARDGSAIVLAGGGTPREAYALAAAAEPDWGHATVWLGDERLVPLDDPRSNARQLREALFERLRVAPVTHLVETELPPDEAAAAYDRELRDTPLHLALLGLGPDGHTASLFPSSPALEERERWAVSAKPALEPWVDRVTMTLPALDAAQHVVFLATGRAKAEAAARAFVEAPSRATPASLVRSRSGRTMAILDREAAALLPEPPRR